jgi:hypothetical protein
MACTYAAVVSYHFLQDDYIKLSKKQILCTLCIYIKFKSLHHAV